MKPKETQLLGLYILGLISFIILSFAQLHSLINYLKLTSLDSVTSFAVVDAVFFTIIKLLITLYIVFYLSVEIRGQFIQRERLRNRLEAKLKKERISEAIKQMNEQPFQWDDDNDNKGRPIDANINQFSPKDLLDEVKIQDESSKLNFEPVIENDITAKTILSYKDLQIRYGTDAVASLDNTVATNLRLNVSNEETLQALNLLKAYYGNKYKNLPYDYQHPDAQYIVNIREQQKKLEKLLY